MKEKIDSTIWIFIATIIGYGVATLYEIGFKDFYNIPFELTELTTTKITFTVMTTIGLSVIGFAYRLMFSAETDLRKHLIEPVLKRAKSTPTPYSRNFLSGIPLFALVIIVILALMNKIEIGLHTESLFWFIFLMSMYFSIKKYHGLTLIILIVLIGVTVNKSGYEKALDKENYMILENENLIVIDYYKDKAIVARVDLDKKIIYPEYQFIKLESTDKSPQKLILKHTGKLKMSN